MKKSFMGFEEAHTILLCLLYLPIPEFVIMLFFQETPIVCHILIGFMVLELLGALVIYLGLHRCPECHARVAQLHMHRDCKCHYCGHTLIYLENVVEAISTEVEDSIQAEVVAEEKKDEGREDLDGVTQS